MGADTTLSRTALGNKLPAGGDPLRSAALGNSPDTTGPVNHPVLRWRGGDGGTGDGGFCGEIGLEKFTDRRLLPGDDSSTGGIVLGDCLGGCMASLRS
jgi:hypothetical protein